MHGINQLGFAFASIFLQLNSEFSSFRFQFCLVSEKTKEKGKKKKKKETSFSFGEDLSVVNSLLESSLYLPIKMIEMFLSYELCTELNFRAIFFKKI